LEAEGGIPEDYDDEPKSLYEPEDGDKLPDDDPNLRAFLAQLGWPVGEEIATDQ
jgi:hypothetical protein